MITRDMWGFGWLERLVRDVQYAFRGLLHNRVYALAAIVTLALGIGANTAIFSLLDSLVLRALPVRDPGRLVVLQAGDHAPTDHPDMWSHPVFEEIRRRRGLPAEFCAWSRQRFDLARTGETEMVPGMYVSANFFDVLGVPAVLGRTFHPDDDRRGGGPDGPVAVISYAFWQRKFGGAGDVVGKSLTLDRIDTPLRIVGVTAPGFFGPDVGRRLDVAVPLGTVAVLSPGWTRLDSRSSHWLQVMARLESGRTPEAATKALRGAQRAIREATMPEQSVVDMDRYLAEPFTLRSAANGVSSLRMRYERPLFVLMVIVLLVLVVACANVANLQLARIAGRRHELVVRRALGASRVRLARQLLVESLLLAVAGTVLGLLLAVWTSNLLVAQLSTSVSQVVLDLSINWRLLGFATAIGAGTVVFFGTVPAFCAARADAQDALRDGRGRLESGRHGLSHVFVAVQIGLSLVLVVAAGLFVQSFTALATRHTGLDVDRVLTVAVNGRPGASGNVAGPASIGAVMDAARAVPGVERVSFCSMVPLSGSYADQVVNEIPGGPALSPKNRTVLVNGVGPGWFAVFGIPILAGRDFLPQESVVESPVIVVNQAFARRFFGRANPLGRTVGFRRSEAQVIGVVEDALYNDVRAAVPPTLYQPVSLRESGGLFVVRSIHGSGAALAPAVVDAISRVNPTLSLTPRPVGEYAGAAVARERIVAMLSGFFGVLALLLAAIGIFGVTAYGVHRRNAEIGLRMALGASRAGVVRLVLGRVLLLVAAGLVAGGAASFWASRLVEALLFGIDPHDPVTFAGAALVLAVVGLLAAAIPAWRASRTDPTTVMRSL